MLLCINWWLFKLFFLDIRIHILPYSFKLLLNLFLIKKQFSCRSWDCIVHNVPWEVTSVSSLTKIFSILPQLTLELINWLGPYTQFCLFHLGIFVMDSVVESEKYHFGLPLLTLLPTNQADNYQTCAFLYPSIPELVMFLMYLLLCFNVSGELCALYHGGFRFSLIGSCPHLKAYMIY